MLKQFKQAIDRWAIRVASESLAPGEGNISSVLQARELLCNRELLRPLDKPAHLRHSDSGSFEFRSNVDTGSPRNDLVHGRLVLAGEDWRTRPFVMLVHGWNAELHYQYVLPRVARALNRHGLNAALIELPYHLQRRPQQPDPIRDFISADLPVMLTATRQAISDIHALALWCRAQGCPSVAVWGFSLGAWLVGLYLCQTSFPSAAVLTTPVSDLERAVHDLAFCHPIRAGFCGEPVELTSMNLVSNHPQIPAANIQVVEGAYDVFVPTETYRELTQAWSLPGWQKFPEGHISILVSRKATKDSIAWLRERLV